MTFSFFPSKIKVPGLANYINENDLLNAGFRLVYNYPYSHLTTSTEILNIRDQCSTSSILCVGGNRPIDLLLRVVACANCLNITTKTNLDQPKMYGAAYWYFTDLKSFDFSPTSTITQNIADNYDKASNLRVSWHLDEKSGGWRLGDLVELNDNSMYYKKIYIK